MIYDPVADWSIAKMITVGQLMYTYCLEFRDSGEMGIFYF